MGRPWSCRSTYQTQNKVNVQNKVSADGLVKDLQSFPKECPRNNFIPYLYFPQHSVSYIGCVELLASQHPMFWDFWQANVCHLLRGHPGAGNKQLPRVCSLDCPCSILVSKCGGSLIILVALSKLRMEKPIKCCIPLNLIEALSNTLVVLGFHPDYLSI